ncbi:MAG: HIT family protein [Propionibacteriaceae bacterium]|jgi:diadenosine tetraphosphate (Ap4A) HIT family hydrolase|nr:HIT family protein [Propionibacteriaceae bacterium]
MPTVFSRIIAGEIPGRFVWADEHCVAFATIEPITPGHMLVVPRVEVAKFTVADDELLAQLMSAAKAVGRACELAFDAPRAALLIAGFEIDHLHLHVLPAWGETELTFANARPASGAELDDACERVRTALIALGHGAQVPTSPPAEPFGRRGLRRRSAFPE